MSDALRPSSLFTTAAPATAPSGVLATLPNPPPEVSQLPIGTTVRGTVIGHDDQGHLLVRTDLGTLAVSTKANPPPGSDVVLQIRASGTQLHVLLMHSDTASSGGGAKGVPAVLPAGGTQIPDQLTLGHNLRAILQAPASSGAGQAGIPGAGALEPALAAALARLTPGSPIVLRITAVEGPAGPLGAPVGVSPQGATPAGLPAGLPTGPAPGATPNPAGGPAGGLAGGGPTGGPIGAQAAVQAGHPGPPTAPSAALPGALPVAGGVPQAGGQGLAGALVAAPLPSALSAGLAQSPLSTAQGQASSPGPARPVPAANTAPPGPGSAPGSTAPSAPSVESAIPPGLRSAASAAGAAYGAAVRPPQGPVSPSPAVGGPAAPFTQPGPGQNPLAAAHMPNAPSSMQTAVGTNTAASSLTGIVTATTKAGQPVLQTPIGTLSLEARATLPVGSRVVFQLVPESLPRGAAGLPFELEALPSSLARAWPEVEEAARVLHESALPGTANGPGASSIPQPGPRLASGLLFFLAALSGGDVNRWIGDRGVQALKDAGRGNLLARLGQDFGQLSRQVETGGGDWRLFLIPMLDGNQVQQIRFFERHGSHKRGGDGQEDESTHFILEVELTRLGDMQLDGLVRARRFDLMLRTHRPLPEAMRHKITEIFNEANDIAGYAGNIGFQASREWRFMPVAAETLASAGTGLVI